MLAQEQDLTFIITVPNPKMGFKAALLQAPHSPVVEFSLGPDERKYLSCFKSCKLSCLDTCSSLTFTAWNLA